MLEWKERRLVPKMDSVHVMEGYENVCETCEKWGEACEECDVSVPLVTDEWEVKEVTMRQMTLCGIPVGHAYEVEK